MSPSGSNDEGEMVKSLKEEIELLKARASVNAKRRRNAAGGAHVVGSDIQETILRVESDFEKCISDLEATGLNDPDYSESEVKAMVEEVEMMCIGYRKALRMPRRTNSVEETKHEEKDDAGDREEEEEKSSSTSLADLEAELAKYKKENVGLTSRLTRLQSQLDELNESRTTAREQYEKLEESSNDNVRSLEKQVSTLRSALDDMASSSSKKENDHPVQLAKLEAKLVDVKDGLSTMTKKKEELERKLAGSNDNLTDVKEKLARKREQLSDVTKSNAILEEEKGALESSIKDIDGELNDFRRKYQSVKDKLKLQEDQTSDVESNLKKEKKAFDKAREEWKLKSHQLEDDLDVATKNYDDAASDLAEAKKECSRVEEKLDAEMKDNKTLQKRMEKMEFTTKEALRDVAEMKTKVELLEEEINIQKDQADMYKQKFSENQRKIKKLNEHIVTLQGNIRVFCRLRPLSPKEEADLENDEDAPDMDKAIQYLDDGKMLFHGAMYDYDSVFDPNTSQTEVFKEVQSAIASAMDGYRVCIFAYGQTGSGKTHTMEGPRSDRGVNFRALEEMFDLSSSEPRVDYEFHVSILEVYNETVCDLLVRGNGGTDLAIRKNREEVYVEGLTECQVENTDDVEELMQLASRNRSTASNNVNEHSSRSHLVLSVKVAGVNKVNGTKVVGKLNMIDLAGSERLKNTAASGQRLKEAQNINKSLSALGDVVSALGNSKASHVPYRNSKLTFLLQESLRPSCKVLMFVNINPAPKSAGESICSLNFAARCRAVQLGKAKKDNIVVKN